ncbi:FAR1-related sequence 5-like protein [Tanacetum coccineum]
MSPGNMCHGGTNLLTEKYVGPTLSLGNVSLASVPKRAFPSDKSPGKDIVTLPETNVIEEDEIDMNVMQDDLNETTAADVVDVYDIDPEFVPTPNGHKYWVPNVPVDEKPKIDTVFNTFDDAYDMYKEYVVKARFSIRKSGLKRKKGEITHRYVWCNKAGKPRKTVETNTLIEDDNDDGKENENEDGKQKKTRRSKSTLTDCKARIGLKGIVGTNAFKVFDFVENHNHPLIDASNMDLSRARRQLEFGEYLFIHRASLSNIGPQKAHRLRVALLGGFDKVRGMPIDWNNFRRGLNKFIGERDAQMLVDKMVKRQQHVPEFSFYHHTIKNKLVRMFWADETMKCNYAAFGDIVSFDATYDTNKKQPILAVTDHDGALRNVILQVFTQSHHRLCMWHITQKLPAKVLGDVDVDSDFRKDFHKLVWNVYITPSVFQERWHALIQKYNLSENKWLSDMYEIRDRWVPGYFSEVPLCGLMKTTSRSESSNAFFQVYSHHGNSLVHFMLCFESAMEKQRYTQRVLDNENAEKTPVMLTKLPIERHACAVYTHSIFRDVQSEICKGLYACSQIGSCSVGGVEECIIRQRDKRRNNVVEAKVSHNQEDGSFECSCGHYNRHGFLCRHVFCVFGTLGMDKIPENYISRRWRKNPLPDHLRDKRHRYGPCIEESESLASDIYSRVEDCINLIRNDPDKLKVFLAKVTDMKKELENDMSSQNEPQNKDALYEDLLGVKAPDTVVIMNPNKCPNKGHRRFKSAAEKGKAIKKARTNRKVPFKHRECSKCGQMFHNKRTCDEKRLPDEEYQALLKKKKDAGEVDVNESEEDEEDVEVDDVDEDDGTDEHDEDEDED